MMIFDNIEFQSVDANGVTLRLASAGSGPLIILCHGWPESWYSWRHQLPVLADAGFRAVAYDVRGYGESDKPHEIEAFTLNALAGDVVGIIDALGYEQAIVVGHDWGGPIALHTALTYPERISAVGSLSVPHYLRPPIPALDLWREVYKDRFFYQLYFLKEGIAEAEFEADLRRSLYLTYTAIDARGMRHQMQQHGSGLAGIKGPEASFLESMHEFAEYPHWLQPEDLDYLVSQFELSGKRGPFNRYRAQTIDWHESAHLDGAMIEQPAFFITGDLDPVSQFVPLEARITDVVKANYRNLLIAEELDNVGHWTAEEAPERVNHHLLSFLGRL
jgi:pimeloyl-ACP methyl ester carboxylesterase